MLYKYMLLLPLMLADVTSHWFPGVLLGLDMVPGFIHKYSHSTCVCVCRLCSVYESRYRQLIQRALKARSIPTLIAQAGPATKAS